MLVKEKHTKRCVFLLAETVEPPDRHGREGFSHGLSNMPPACGFRVVAGSAFRIAPSECL